MKPRVSINALVTLLAASSVWLVATWNWDAVALVKAMMRLPARERFEIAATGAASAQSFRKRGEHSGDEIGMIADRVWRRSLRTAPGRPPRIALRATAIGRVFPEGVTRADIRDRHLEWEAGAALLNAKPDAALKLWSSWCQGNNICDVLGERLRQAARYVDAITFARLYVKTEANSSEAKRLATTTLKAIEGNRATHSEIVRGCQVWYSFANSHQQNDLNVADIGALCIEGLLTDPSAQSPLLKIVDLKTCLNDAKSAGRSTKYQLAMAGWAEVKMGNALNAKRLLLQAQNVAPGGYARDLSGEKLDQLIARLLREHQLDRTSGRE